MDETEIDPGRLLETSVRRGLRHTFKVRCLELLGLEALDLEVWGLEVLGPS